MDIDRPDPIPVSERCYRLLLRCFPRRFRAEAEEELLECFRKSWPIAYREGPAARVRFWLALLLDLRAAPAEWVQKSSRGPEGRSDLTIGLGIGLVGAGLVTRLLKSFLFGVSPLDPLTYGIIALLFGAVGAVACLVPMRRALRTEPLEVLRHD